MNKDVFILGFIIGVVIISFIDFGNSFILLFLLLSIFLFLIEHFYIKFLKKEVNLKKPAFILIAISFGMFWYQFRDFNNSNLLKKNLGESVSITVVVEDEPEEKEGITNLIVSFSENKILIKTNNFPKYKYGDKLKIVGELKEPENFSDDFDYKAYLAKDGIFYLIDRPKISLISHDAGGILSSKLFEIKNIFVNSIKSSFSEPQSSLLSGLIFGAKDSLGKVWLDKFRTVGLSHIIVLSGYNLTIIADATMKVFSNIFSKSLSISLGSISIVLFAFMTGGGASTVRATIMALIILLARATGRMYEAGRALVLAGFFMVIYNPKVIVFDMSFQLSFLATLGLIYLSPRIKEKITFLPEKFQFREIVATTLGAQLATIPLIVYKIGQLSIVSLPVNLLVVVFIPATMFFGFFASFLNLFSFNLALLFIGISWFLLSYILFITDIFSSLPFALLNLNLNIIFIVILLCLIFVTFIKNKKEKSTLDDWEITEI